MKEWLQRWFNKLKHGEHHWTRKIVGVLLVIFGLLGFMPVIGFWMIPLGLALLAVDFPVIRRFNQRALRGWERVRRRFTRAKATPGRSGRRRKGGNTRDKGSDP
jgi:purine-cytosine permease-like protein